MKIVGCDFHLRWQQVAVFDAETGEITEHKLMNGDGEAERFYREMGGSGADRRRGVREQVWVGDAAGIRASYVRKQKTDNRFVRQLLVEAAQSACRYDAGFRRQYQARCHHKPKGVARVAAARRLTVRLYWMLRQNAAIRRSPISRAARGCPRQAEAMS